MDDHFIRKLRHGTCLVPEDEELLLSLAQPVRQFEARRDIVVEGDAPRSLNLVLDGWACSYRLLENGRSQITSLFLPGDLCEPFGVLPRFSDQTLAALTSVRIASVSLSKLQEAARSNPRITEALWWDLLASFGIERERIVSLGRRTALERLGHLFCELHLRLQMVGLADDKGFELPLTQTDLADVLGLSAVHVNRSLRELKRIGLISLTGRRLSLRDIVGLRAASLFDPAYLHLHRGNRTSPSAELSVLTCPHARTRVNER